MNIGRLAWIIAAALFILVVNVSLTIAYMFVLPATAKKQFSK